eukprot:TRINITY_DN18533_c0_g2_i3.p1 TRINITY_DN18533_c0_g2~~TRINITY_DN18533_c0_g2_i3.p1  ORF type:complete len:314 (-),score=75.64 TRINITY_DN18533_c0_g2_i3:795-1736(-)
MCIRDRIHTVLDYWLSRGHRCIALLPNFWFDPARQTRKEGYQPGVVLLQQLQQMGLVAPVPEDNVIQAAKMRTEPPIIQYSKEHGGVIVTLDTFGDVVRQKSDDEGREALRAWIRMFTMPYNFVGDKYVPQEDFVMPSLYTHRLVSGEQPIEPLEVELLQQRPESPNPESTVFDDEELPPVAAFRRQAMLDVMKSICTVETGNSRHSSRFLTRKVAADVFNKWVFQTHATGSSRANSDENEGWTRAQKPLDAVIPSCGNSTLTQYIERQLVSGYDVSSDAAATAATQLSQQCTKAAQGVNHFAQMQRRWCPYG